MSWVEQLSLDQHQEIVTVIAGIFGTAAGTPIDEKKLRADLTIASVSTKNADSVRDFYLEYGLFAHDDDGLVLTDYFADLFADSAAVDVERLADLLRFEVPSAAEPDPGDDYRPPEVDAADRVKRYTPRITARRNRRKPRKFEGEAHKAEDLLNGSVLERSTAADPSLTQVDSGKDKGRRPNPPDMAQCSRRADPLPTQVEESGVTVQIQFNVDISADADEEELRQLVRRIRLVLQEANLDEQQVKIKIQTILNEAGLEDMGISIDETEL